MSERLGDSALRGRGAERLARGLGWFSLGLGLPQVLAPHAFARAIGLPEGEGAARVVRLVGLRELATGFAILARPDPVPGLAGRIAGDLIDMGLLGRTLSDGEGHQTRQRAALAAAAAVCMTDAAAVRLSARSDGTAQRVVRAATTVRRSREETYRFWRDFDNLPSFMSHLEHVEVYGERSHWVAKAPAGRTVEWDADLVADVPGELLAWRSVGGDIDHAGRVTFNDAPGGRGTEVVVEMAYRPPGAALGRAIAKVFGEEPEQQVKDDLRRFKQVLEAGEVVISEGSLGGTNVRNQMRQHVAQPPLAA